jgi:hypothetical protein
MTIEGEIYFWRRDRDEAVHTLETSMEHAGKPIEVACKPVGDDFMFAVRSQDGVVRIWKAQGPSPRMHRVEPTSTRPLDIVTEDSAPSSVQNQTRVQ